MRWLFDVSLVTVLFSLVLVIVGGMNGLFGMTELPDIIGCVSSGSNCFLLAEFICFDITFLCGLNKDGRVNKTLPSNAFEHPTFKSQGPMKEIAFIQNELSDFNHPVVPGIKNKLFTIAD